MSDEVEKARQQGFIIGAMLADAVKSHDDEDELKVLAKGFLGKFAEMMNVPDENQSTKGLKVIMWIHDTTEDTANTVRQVYGLQI